LPPTSPQEGYYIYSGTSMATPHVTGAVALYASTHSGASAIDIKDALLNSARYTPTQSLAGKTATGGRLDVLKLMTDPPAAPTFADAKAASAGEIDVTWTDQSTDEAGFVVERSAGTTGTTWAQVGTVVSTSTAGTGTVYTFQDKSVIDNTTYTYRVRATHNGVPSTASNTATATTPALPGTPNAPTALTVSPVSTSSIKLTWADNSGAETGFVVERSATAPTDTTVWTTVTTTAANVKTYTDSGRSASTVYWYRVRAVNGSGSTRLLSAPTNVASVSTLGTGTGLTGKYYDYSDVYAGTPPTNAVAFGGSVKFTRVDTVNFNWGTGSPGRGITSNTFAARWTGQIQPTFTDVYTFTAYADDGVRLWVDGKLVIDAWRVNWGDLAGTTATALQAGRKYDVQLDYFENTQGAQIRLDWQTQGGGLARQPVPKSQLYSTLSSPTIYAVASTTNSPANTTAAADIFSSSPIDVLDVEDPTVL
jgi:hypothetical protein